MGVGRGRGNAPIDATVGVAVLFFAGSLVCLPTLVLRPWPEVWLPGVVFNCVTAAMLAVLLYLFRSRIGPLLRHVALCIGAIDIAAALLYGGGGGATALYAVLYLWVGIYVGAYLTPRAATAYMVFAMTLGSIALAIVCTPAVALTIALTTMVTAAAASVIVGVLTAQIRALANRDPLTGLGNRRALDERLAMLQSRRRPRPVGLVILDLDGFKEVNDAQGHAAGDAVLVDAASCWSSLLRDGDLLARVGGDEFVAVLDDCPPERVEQVAQRLARATPRPVTASVGVVWSDGRDDLEQLLTLADGAVYRSKSRGGGEVTVASPELVGTYDHLGVGAPTHPEFPN